MTENIGRGASIAPKTRKAAIFITSKAGSERMELSADILDKIGDWNPQLYRELKGRFKLRNVGITIAIAAFLEGTISFFCSQNSYSSLHVQWEAFFFAFNWILPLCLWVSGVYLIVSDIGKEKSRETLEFIRLSPQTSQSLLLGKLLGVPNLIYLGILACLPLHFFAGLQADFPAYAIFEMYIAWGVIAVFLYNVGLLLVLNLPNRTAHYRATAALSSFLALIASQMFIGLILGYQENFHYIDLNWFFLSFDSQPELTAIWFFSTVFAVNTLIWQVANRHFQNPLKPLIGKHQSYWITVCTQLWFLGFMTPNQSFVDSDIYQVWGCLFLFFATPSLILLLSAFMSPSRSRLQEWKRYQRFSWQDLFLGEKSPIMGAIALNLGITLLIWIPWILLAPFSSDSQFNRWQLLAGVVLTFTFLIIYATLIQSIRGLARTKNKIPLFYLFGLILVVSPLLLAVAGELSPQEAPTLWLFSPVPAAAVSSASLFAIFLTFTSQLVAFASLTYTFNRSLQRDSESELKQLLNHD